MSVTSRLHRWARAILSLAAAGLFACSSATAQVDSNRLYRALLDSRPALGGFSGPAVTAIRPNESDTSQGMIGAVAMVFRRANASAEIRYAVFDQSEDAASYAQAASERLGGRIFFPFLPDADCAQAPGKQLCTFVSGKVYILAISTGIVSANTHERQTLRGISAGNLAQFAMENLRRTVGSVGGGPAWKRPSAPPPPARRSSGPCDILSQADAEAAMGSPVGSPTRGPSNCYYQSRFEPGEGVSLEFNEGGREKFDFDRNRIMGARPLNGIGEGAFAFASAAGFVQVYAIAHGRYFTVMVFNHRDRDARRTAANLARTIAARIAR